ncbi:MAG: formyl transferase [Gemmatimonadaceae bacterium]|nr:formyl transferase [Gemmatimonadaceae bacterium]
MSRVDQARPRTVLICHHDAPLHLDGLARWLASWSDLAGIVVIEEPGGLLRKRLRREWRRVGLRIVDVLAQRVHYRLTSAARDRAWIEERVAGLRERFPVMPRVPTVRVASPNTSEAQRLIADARPDIVLALCKNLLAERVYSIPVHGTIVLHPGICPEYRNAHGCFWALANDDLDRVGMTVLRIDRGIDTGPVLGWFRASYDEVNESHIVIQHRMTLDNLDGIAELLRRVATGKAKPIPVQGRASHEWGQPWLTKLLYWKRQARRRRDATHHA